MKIGRLMLVTAAGLLLAFGAAALGCTGGGGGGVTLEEFFQRLDELDNEFETKSSDLDAELQDLSEEEFLEQAPDIFREQIGLIGEFVASLEELDPPDEASALVDEAVSAGREVEEQFGQLLDEAEGAASIEELFAIFENEEFGGAIDRFEQVCLDAEQLAADNDITIDLDCEDEEG